MANTKKITDDKSVKTEAPVETAVVADTGDKIETEKSDTPIEKVANDTAASIDEMKSAIASFAPDGAVDNAGVYVPKIEHNRPVSVMSVTFGGLTWISEKSKSHYCWNSIGDVENMTFDELVVMHNMSRDFMFTPYVIILDSEVAKYFRLDAAYKEFAYVNKLEELFNEGDMKKIEEALNKIKRTNMRNVAISKIRALKENGKLTNIYIIRLIQKILCFDLDDIG